MLLPVTKVEYSPSLGVIAAICTHVSVDSHHVLHQDLTQRQASKGCIKRFLY